MMRHTEPRWTPLALAVAAALPAAAASLGAQQQAPPPPPSVATPPSAPGARAPRAVRAPRACDGCDTVDLAALQKQLEGAQRELERTMDALAAQREALLASRDSSGDLQEAYARLLGDARRARQRYDAVLTTMMRHQLERSRADIERAMRSAQFAVQMPSGWLGAALSMQYTVERDGGREIMRFQDYPVVESVEPNSPAERAGLEARDRLTALNGRDVLEGTEPLTRLLRPGNRLRMRVLRGDSTRSLTVVVGRRPEGELVPGSIVARALISAPAAPATPAAPPARPPTALVPPLPPVPVAPFTVVTRDGMQIELGSLEPGTLAGAQLQRVGDLRDYFGVQDGLLVLRVIPGTVAARSGLRGGDVILRADDAPITTPLTLRRAMDRSTDQTVKLEIVRKKKKESVVLRWDR